MVRYISDLQDMKKKKRLNTALSLYRYHFEVDVIADWHKTYALEVKSESAILKPSGSVSYDSHDGKIHQRYFEIPDDNPVCYSRDRVFLSKFKYSVEQAILFMLMFCF